jgi:hypothetical protein
MSQPGAERKQNLLGLLLICCVAVPGNDQLEFSAKSPCSRSVIPPNHCGSR